ncbi:MAG TPA: NADH-ubiquinone oxidoreductase-F iron-sulfur binding region domain-containing protein [Candidatus Sulfomarinibacteraceae bacterium]|nr:NADH-ubiquinone oxidoreductase-F iron-sulfur binding region domain-containing protein [Candidatus Sulfomarinibacteraceae bacterium]
MTDSQILETPQGWPAILLPRTAPGAVRGTGPAEAADLEAATRAGAFEGLRRAIRDLGATGTIAAIGASGLRGRGGAGYPAAEKWRAASLNPAAGRVVVANGYGADPASRTDQVLLERNPFAVIEGLAIAAFAIGAEEAIIAVRTEATSTIRILEAALAAAAAAGFVGPDVMGAGRHLDVSVRTVHGAYLLGEETILLKALEGKRGQPEQRPPHPATSGLRGLPTVVHNVQTLAAIPWIVRNGPEAFAKIGAADCPGTILVGVRGPEASGVAEVPLGTPLRAIAALVAPAAAAPVAAGPGRRVKAVLVGGPSGGILPPDALDTPYTFDALRAAGAHVGSGSVIVADDRACIVDLARVLTRYCADEACGKTIPCRIGTRRLSEIGDRLAAGTSRAGDLDLLTDLAADIIASALCDHERLATLPLLSGMRYFRAELDEHLERGSCPAGVCHPIAMAASPTH